MTRLIVERLEAHALTCTGSLFKQNTSLGPKGKLPTCNTCGAVVGQGEDGQKGQSGSLAPVFLR